MVVLHLLLLPFVQKVSYKLTCSFKRRFPASLFATYCPLIQRLHPVLQLESLLPIQVPVSWYEGHEQVPKRPHVEKRECDTRHILVDFLRHVMRTARCDHGSEITPYCNMKKRRMLKARHSVGDFSVPSVWEVQSEECKMETHLNHDLFDLSFISLNFTHLRGCRKRGSWLCVR